MPEVRRLALPLLVLALAACEKPVPVYDDDIGVQAEPAEVGSLAGTFALKTINATLVHVPFETEDEVIGGGVNLRLVTREWDAEQQLYLQRSTLCGGYNFEVLGVTTSVPEPTYREVPESTEEWVKVDHELGTYEAGGHIQLWAIQLDDPFDDAFPADKAEAESPAFADRIFDIDDDGHPGLTLFVSGAVSGEVYAIQRKRVDLEGVIQGANYAVGLAQNTFESVTLGNNNPLLDASSQGSAEPHPDPKMSWFEEVRVDDTTTCEDVVGFEDSGVLNRRRPF